MLNFDQLAFDYEPYPIGLARDVFTPQDYDALVNSFPKPEAFAVKPSKGEKYSLSRHNNGAAYRRHLKMHPPWARFFAYVTSRQFVASTFDTLSRHGVDLGPAGRPNVTEKLRQRIKALRKGSPPPRFPKLKSRFEFSLMSSVGGCIRPHTDHPAKLVTLVVPMLHAGTWDTAIGGGTSVVKPRDERRYFNATNHYLDFDEVQEIKTFPFNPNQCLVFVKTFNSWHAVWPMSGTDAEHYRRTITVNIEAS